MEATQQLDRWHQTRTGHLVFGLVELLIAYGFASWAIDTAHTWCYVLTLLFLFGGGRNLVQVFHRSNNGKRKQAKTAG